MAAIGGAHQSTPAELKQQLEAERAGQPFLLHRDGDGAQRITALAGSERVTVGRGEGTDVRLEWDSEVSRVHAELECVGGAWTVSDDGLSRNGSFVNGERIAGRRRLRDGDVLRFGATSVLYREPLGADSSATEVAADLPEVKLSEAQKRVLVALCRPFKEGSQYATPATNQEVADELFLSVDAVKTHLRTLFEKFAVGDLPQNQKRVRLVELALKSGAISPREL